MDRVFINAGIPLVFAVTGWLQNHVRVTPAGVRSLSHLLVIVPTQQAGRRLRLALAESTGGCLPPHVRLPAQVIAAAAVPSLPVASPAETTGLLCRLLLDLDLHRFPNLFPEKGLPRDKSFSWALGVARQLNDLWNILQENALTMTDVAAQIGMLLSGEDLDIEVARWQDLSALEAFFFDALQMRGRTPAPLVRKQAVAAPQLPDSVERIVLPALVDAQPALYPVLEKWRTQTLLSVLIHADPSQDMRFDTWGRPEPAQWLGDCSPVLPLTDRQITLAANSVGQARLVAAIFANIPTDEELPSLGLADDSLFSELQSAFLAHDIPLHNPAAYPLVSASLGRLIQQLERLCRRPLYPVLAAFLREADVMRWLESRLASEPDFSYAGALQTLDEIQRKHLPQTLEAVQHFCKWQPFDTTDSATSASGPSAQARDLLHRLLDEIRTLLDPRGRSHLEHVTAMLQSLFAARTLHERTPGDRELAAAASATLAVFEELSSDVLSTTLDDAQRSLLFEALLTSASYQLEPENADALLTEGWLELPWSPASELVITGFNEGSVPDAVMGHAFLPDRLRQVLGLTSNERRTARDTYLLHALLASRPSNAVRIFLERVSSNNDVRKPSRLLFLCDETTLTARAKKLFHDAESAAAGHHRTLPNDWRLALPIPTTLPATLSATAFKTYLACPFTFFLRNILKMEPCDIPAVELDASAFGNLCHTALDSFGRSSLKDSSDPDTIANFLHAEVRQILHHQFGETLPTVIRMQAATACERLKFFAFHQAQMRREGWQIHAVECPLTMIEQGCAIRGRADRIDYHADTNTWRIIDYKTWDKLGKNEGLDRFASSRKADLESAAQRGLPSVVFADKPRVWVDLQLPLYLLMAEAGAIIPANAKSECGYFVLGETQEESLCKTWDFASCRDDAVNAIRWVIHHVEAGIFWPPTPRNEWARDFGSLFLETPEQSVGLDWIDDQNARASKGFPTCAP